MAPVEARYNLAMDITHPLIEDYIRGLLRIHDEPVLLEMEAEGKERGFPIVGRMVGVVLEILARAIGAKRVIELGSGYGYSGYWFSRAVGPDGELHLTDGDPENEKKALDYLGRAELDGPVRFHVGDAVKTFQSIEGGFDVVYSDIDKWEYPHAWEVARERVRVGGLYLCDNVLWSGRRAGSPPERPPAPGTAALKGNNPASPDAQPYVPTIGPTRAGGIRPRRTG